MVQIRTLEVNKLGKRDGGGEIKQLIHTQSHAQVFRFSATDVEQQAYGQIRHRIAVCNGRLRDFILLLELREPWRTRVINPNN